MKLIDALTQIKALSQAVFASKDIAISLQISDQYANKILRRLADAKAIVHLRRGLWGLPELIDPLMLVDYLTAPLPSYVSLHTALYYHGLISQIPDVIYGVSLARTRRYVNPIATYSIHHINPKLFFDFEIQGKNHIRIAKPEKALFDYFYLKSSKTMLFAKIVELEINVDFNWQLLEGYVIKINSVSRQQMVANAITKIKPTTSSG